MLASKTPPTPIAFALSDVTYTGSTIVPLNFNLLNSIGITFIIGISCINTFGFCLARHIFSKSHLAPSNYNPFIYEPDSNLLVHSLEFIYSVTIV